MRLFVAVELPAEPAAHLAAALDRPPDPRWHLTLAFLGDLAGQDAPLAGQDAPLAGPPPVVRSGEPAPAALLHALAQVPVVPFRLALAGAGTFGRGRVLWVGVGEGRPQLTGLADAVAAASRSAGVVLEDRPYRPHLTVRRGRDLQPGPLADYAGPSWPVTGFVLMDSRGGRYEQVARYPAGPDVTAATTSG